MGISAGVNLGLAAEEHGANEKNFREDQQFQAELDNIRNAGLSPAAQEDALRTLHAKNPSALKRHVENLVGRLQGKAPQPTPDAYPATTETAANPNAGVQVGGKNLPAPVATFNDPGAKTQAERRQQILSGGTTPEQRRINEIQAAADAKPQPAPRNQTPQDVLGAIIADDVSKGVDPSTDPRVQRVSDVIQSNQKQPAPKVKKAPKIITGSGGEPVGVTAIDESGNEKNYYEKDMKGAPEDVSTLFKSDQSAFKDKEHRDEARQAATFSREVALLGKRVSDQIAVSDYRGAQKAVLDAEKKSNDATVQYSIMEKAAPAAKNHDGAAMYTVLANFVKSAIGGTGMRVTQTEWNQAQQTRPWLQGVTAQFGPDGYLTGVKLAPEQVDSMVREAKQKSDAMNEAVDTVKQQHADELEQGQELKAGGKAPAPKKASSGGSKGTVSLAKAKTLPQNKGKSDAEITADAEKHGYQVKP